MQDPIFLDYETLAIQDRPKFPPDPVGLAVLDRTGEYETKYYAFGHASENNSSFGEVKALLEKIWASGRHICFHNAAFDVEVTMEHFGLPFPKPELLHDTLISAFLFDCHAKSLSLKDLAVDWMGIKPEERDELFEWLVANVPEVAKKPKQAGAYISCGPANLVGQYALADVRLTAELFDFTARARADMPEAYLREIRLMEILIDNSRKGVRVDRKGLQQAEINAKLDIEACHKWLVNYFGTDINFSSGKQLAEVIIAKGCYDSTKEWPASSKTGKPLTDKETLAEILNDTQLVAVLRYYGLMEKLVGTYIEPWLEMSEGTGRIYTTWNQVRGEHGGTRTGRLSGRPSLQTMPTRYPKNELPADLEIHGIPMIRGFILPDEGHKIISADFNAQELRIFAHFEDGQLGEQYRLDERADLHQFAADLMTKTSGREVSRTYSKGVSFAVLYGAGPKKISEMLEIDYELAKTLVDLYTSSVAPGLQTMNDDMRTRYARRLPIKTLGGRFVKGEPPTVVNGRLRKFDYKMTNLLIQGSAADQAKQAMIDYARKAQGSRLLLSMHDELVITAEESVAQREADLLTYCMCHALPMDVPMVADAVIGNTYQEVK